jgi:hypothetical protein
MDVLWAALAICIMVGVTFYVLAAAWQRTLRSHSRALRALFQRLDALEAMEDPLMRRRIGELMPSPLEQVHILSFRLSDRFWRTALGATDQQLVHVREHGTFIGSVKIEIWRSHVSITLRELLPQGKSGGWQARTLDIYESESAAPTALWELRLEPEAGTPAAETPSVQLRYENKGIVLAARTSARATWPQDSDRGSVHETIVFCIPLDMEQLGEFRMAEDEIENGGTEDEATVTSFGAERHSAVGSMASFSHQDDRQGFDWELRSRNLNGRTSSPDWTIMEPPRIRRVS